MGKVRAGRGVGRGSPRAATCVEDAAELGTGASASGQAGGALRQRRRRRRSELSAIS